MKVSCADKAHSSSVKFDECESVSLGIETLGVIPDVNDVACADAHGSSVKTDIQMVFWKISFMCKLFPF